MKAGGTIDRDQLSVIRDQGSDFREGGGHLHPAIGFESVGALRPEFNARTRPRCRPPL